MKRKKIIVLLSILFILVIGIFVFFFTADGVLKEKDHNTSYEKSEYNEDIETLTEENSTNENKTTDQNTNSNESDTEELKKEEPPISNNKVQHNSSVKKDDKNSKQNSTDSNTKKENKVEINDNKENSNNSNSSNSSTTPEEKVENNDTASKNENNDTTPKVWEELGMSEYDYYNKPIWNWATITHSNLDSCIADGEKAKQEELNKGSGKAVLYNCYHLYSHSGKYLGEMLEIEYLG